MLPKRKRVMNRTNYILIVLLSLILLSFSLAVASEPPQISSTPPDDPRVLDQEIRQAIDALRESALVKELGIPQERTTLLLEKMQTARYIRQTYLTQRSQLEHQLELIITQSPADQQQIHATLQALERIKRLYYQQMGQADQDVQKLLSPEEQARYVVFQKNFNKRLQDVILHIRQQRPPTSPSSLQLLRQQPEESVIRQSR
jgi:hypothetical protein